MCYSYFVKLLQEETMGSYIKLYVLDFVKINIVYILHFFRLLRNVEDIFYFLLIPKYQFVTKSKYFFYLS